MTGMSLLARRLAAGVVRGPRRLSEHVEARLKQQACISGIETRFLKTCRINNNRDRSSITVGSHCIIAGQLLTFGHGGSISIGDYCFFGENSRIWSANEIKIGNHVLISHDVNIHDSASHALSADHRRDHFATTLAAGLPKVLSDVPDAPVIIEDDAWLGFGATVLKGVVVGRGSIIAAQAVVTKNVAPFTVVAGNPAYLIGEAHS